MAKNQGKVYLGYEDECVHEKNQTLLSYTVNKIGGFPDWPPLENVQGPSKCPLCGLHRILVTQCYAPLDNTVYHRTLYIFACISPNCWIQSESWLCIRSQIQDSSNESTTVAPAVVSLTDTNSTWCSGADDWEDDDNGDSANGNVMMVDNACANDPNQKYSDEDEESNSIEVETVEQALGNLKVFDAHNANTAPVQGAVGAVGMPTAAAELEGGDEPDLVTVDTPTMPKNDIQALLHETAELPQELRSRLLIGPLQFVPKFIYVEEEIKKSSKYQYDDKVADLLNKYRKENEMELCPTSPGGGGGGGGGADEEQYEESAPAHGDRLFHAFLTRLAHHPGQILRYSRDEPPVLGAPLPADSPDAVSKSCLRCGARVICELQLLPAFADTLRLLPSNASLSHLHFLSVLVFTCSQSCWQPGDAAVKEVVVFQPEI